MAGLLPGHYDLGFASERADQYIPGPGSQGMFVSLHGAVAKAATRGAG
jgi:hypothetical protein